MVSRPVTSADAGEGGPSLRLRLSPAGSRSPLAARSRLLNASSSTPAATTNLSDAKDGSGQRHPAERLTEHLEALAGLAKTAAKNGFRLASHNYYAPKSRDCITGVRREFLLLKANFPPDRYPLVAKQLAGLDAPLTKLEQGLALPPRELLQIVEVVLHTIASDLEVAIQSDSTHHAAQSPFLPADILRPGVYRKILEEANVSIAQGCPNACAAMLRRLTESLIIEAFEAHKIEAQIKDATGEYLELKALIGKAVAEPILKLTRNSRNALPNLKFLGDLSLHGRRNLVRNDDLERLRNDARIAIEELAHHLP